MGEAIFAGVVVGLSMNLVLNLLGVAAGLMSLDVLNRSTPDDNAPMIAALWNGAAMLVSSFIGGYVAARMLDSNVIVMGFYTDLYRGVLRQSY